MPPKYSDREYEAKILALEERIRELEYTITTVRQAVATSGVNNE